MQSAAVPEMQTKETLPPVEIKTVVPDTRIIVLGSRCSKLL